MPTQWLYNESVITTKSVQSNNKANSVNKSLIQCVATLLHNLQNNYTSVFNSIKNTNNNTTSVYLEFFFFFVEDERNGMCRIR